MILMGKILDEEFVDILSNHPDLKISDIILLDQVQKKKDISEEELKQLKKLGFVEGRKPNLFLSHSLIKPINDEVLKVEYIRNKGFDDEYYKNMIIEYLKKWNEASRKQIDNLLWDKLPDILGEKSKINKITNLLQGLKKSEKIVLRNSKKWNINL